MTTEELYNKLSDSRTPDQRDFHTGKCFLLLKDPFGLWCSYHAPKEAAVQENNLYENMRGKTDRSNRDEWITNHCAASEVIFGANDAERFKKTLDAMQRGVDGIVGAALWDLKESGIWGSVNLLFKVNGGKSVFGDYHYKIVQLKRANDLKDHYAMQTILMNRVLGAVQGFAPRSALFVLKNKEQELDCSKTLDKALESLELWRAIKDNTIIPDANKPPKAAMPPWRVFANKYTFENKDLVLIPHLSGDMRNILKANGIKNYDDIVSAGLEKIKQLLEYPIADEATALQTYYTAVAYQHKAPVLRQEGLFPVEHKKRNLYFDFEATETFTKNSISFVYLIGIWDKEQDKFVYFIAKNEAEEEIIFKQFADYIGQEGESALYHWTEYEVKKMKALCDTFPKIRPDLEKLIAACVDLKVIIDKAFYLPSPSLSLKAAAPAFGFNWRQSDCGAMDSMVFFTNWLKTGDESLIQKVLMYNEDDCKAMLHIEEALKNSEIIKQ